MAQDTNQFKTIKIWASTRRFAKILSARLDESIVALLHRLVVEEAKRRGIRIKD